MLPNSVLPSYTGRGISSIPATILEAFGGRLEGHPPIDDALLPPGFLDGVTTIVFILVDGLGYHRFHRAHMPCVSALANAGVSSKLTSVLPSTTTAALATLSTGLTPQEHGLIGYKLYLEEVNEIANMIRFSPVNRAAPFPRRRIDPQGFFDHTTLYQHLHEVGASSRVLLRANYVRSPMSRMYYRGAEVIGHAGTHDAFVILRRMIEQRDGSPQLIYFYWDPVDNVSHFTGPDSEEVEAELIGFDEALRRHVIERLNAPDVALIISADHGHVHTIPHQRLHFNDHPDLLDLLERPPCGDSRLPYLHVKSGLEDDVRALTAKHFGDISTCVDVEEALASGWFGIGNVHPRARSRLGQLVMAVAGGWKIGYRWSAEELESIGCHGALDAEEMEVPLIAARL